MDTITVPRPTKETATKTAEVAAVPKKATKPALVVTAVQAPVPAIERVLLTMMLLGCGAFIVVMVAYVLFPAMSSLLTPSSEWTGTGP